MISWIRNKLRRQRQAAPPPEGLHLGVQTSNGKHLVLDDRVLRSHVSLSGRGGVGRTTLLRQMLSQQTRNGRGWVYVDPAGDEGMRDYLASVAGEVGRLGDFYVLDLVDPDNSNTYDVLRAGTAEARANRVLTLFPPAMTEESQAQADQLGSLLARVFDALDAAGKTAGLYELADLMACLGASEAWERLLADVPGTHPAGLALAAALEAMARDTQAGLKSSCVGAAGALQLLSKLKCARVLSHPTPELDFADVLSKGKMCYIRMPMMEKDSTVLKLERMVLMDVMSALSARAVLPGDQRPPFLVAMDSFPEYGLAESLSKPLHDAVYAQARGMGVSLVPVVDSGSWDRVHEEYGTDTLTANTFTKVYFQQDESTHLAQLHPGLRSGALSSLPGGRFLMCQGGHIVEGLMRYTDTGTPPGFRKRPMPAVESKPRWQAPLCE